MSDPLEEAMMNTPRIPSVVICRNPECPNYEVEININIPEGGDVICGPCGQIPEVTVLQ